MIDWVASNTVNAIPTSVSSTPDPAPVVAPSPAPSTKPSLVIPSVQPWLPKILPYAAGIGFGVFLLFMATKLIIRFDPTAPHPVQAATLPSSMAKVVEVRSFYLKAVQGDGKTVERTEGSAAWRYNNPGKLSLGTFARSHGAIGDDGHLAIFPDYQTGWNAMETLLFKTPEFSALSVGDAMKKWATKGDKYDPVAYLKNVMEAAGVKDTDLMTSLTEDQRQKFMLQIQKEEKLKEGKVSVK
jgi:hypothetical protein